MKNTIINEIVCAMMPVLEQEQLDELKRQLNIQFAKYDVSLKETALVVYDDTDYEIIKKFAMAKLATGKSQRTVKNYCAVIKALADSSEKSVVEMNEDDIVSYLYSYQTTHKIGNTTLRNMRAYLSSFFSWCRKSRIIDRNPMDMVGTIRSDTKIKKPFSDEEVVALKDACETPRELALIDFLDSSMVRIGELVGLDRDNIQINERECVVYGKGRKERIAYFDGAAKKHLEEYLATRTDNNPALFVTERKPTNRLSAYGVRHVLKSIAKRADVSNVHAHRFRRTGATRCLDRGMPLDVLSGMMGHTDTKTTQIYARRNSRVVKNYYLSVYA